MVHTTWRAAPKQKVDISPKGKLKGGHKIMNWDYLFKFGSLAGLLSVIYLLFKDGIKYYFRPKLKITYDKNRDLKVWTFTPTGWVRKFATLHIIKTGSNTAKRCVAIMKIIRKPQGVSNIQDEYALHWADVDYSLSTAAEQPIDIGLHQRRLDVVFTDKSPSINGSWVSMPFALSGNLGINQAYFTPGEYEVEIKVTCENGKGDKARFKIISPNIWDKLDMDQLD